MEDYDDELKVLHIISGCVIPIFISLMAGYGILLGLFHSYFPLIILGLAILVVCTIWFNLYMINEI